MRNVSPRIQQTIDSNTTANTRQRHTSSAWCTERGARGGGQLVPLLRAGAAITTTRRTIQWATAHLTLCLSASLQLALHDKGKEITPTHLKLGIIRENDGRHAGSLVLRQQPLVGKELHYHRVSEPKPRRRQGFPSAHKAEADKQQRQQNATTNKRRTQQRQGHKSFVVKLRRKETTASTATKIRHA